MGLIDLAQALTTLDTSKLARLSMYGEDEDGETVVPERDFQFWPESISDSISMNYVDKAIPGGSHNLKQWVSNGGRTIGFQVQLARTMLREQDIPDLSLGGVVKIPSTIDHQSVTNAPWNRDIRQDVLWLRSFCYPTISADKSSTKPPPICILHAEGLALGHAIGDDFFIGMMAACNITYVRLFENGVPRLATVDLSFAEIVQRDEIQFHGLSDLKRSPFYDKPDQ